MKHEVITSSRIFIQQVHWIICIPRLVKQAFGVHIGTTAWVGARNVGRHDLIFKLYSWVCTLLY